ncbi:acyl carrier protein [Nocardiopsis deserti]|uniref:acyl carrier protein n=1 Tax=Nocardiopsis deserti TaxID=2605988 RepID=UPI00123B1F8A|nr:acyl carrier protein [Nocardiopsis deserti]
MKNTTRESTPDDKVLAALDEIFREVLGFEGVGIDEELAEFESVLIINMVVRIDERLGVTVPIETFLGSPTPRSVAEAVGRAREEGTETR